jgi:hypothetical protein
LGVVSIVSNKTISSKVKLGLKVWAAKVWRWLAKSNLETSERDIHVLKAFYGDCRMHWMNGTQDHNVQEQLDLWNQMDRSFIGVWLLKILRQYGADGGQTTDIGVVLHTIFSQKSMVKRALPKPSAKVEVKSLKNHQKDLGSSYETPQARLDEIYKFGAEFASSFVPGCGDVLPKLSVSVSNSACMEYGRSKGGQMAWVREKLSETDIWSDIGTAEELFNPPPDRVPAPNGIPQVTVDGLQSPLVRPDGVLLQEWDDSIAALKVLNAACAAVHEPGFTLKSGVETVQERGLKARIVTKSQTPVLVLGHLARERLIIGVRKVPEFAGILRGDPPSEILRRLNGGSGVVCSSDLRAASDLLPLDLMKYLVEGLISSGKFSNLEADGLRWCTKPHTLIYRVDANGKPLADGETREVEQKRGLLMGLPTTWLLLSLTHLYWWKTACNEEFSARGRHASSEYQARAVICGDDLAAVAPPNVLNRYEKIMDECGGELSAGKHCRSVSRGVFVEELFEVVPAGDACPTDNDGTRMFPEFNTRNIAIRRRRRLPLAADGVTEQKWTRGVRRAKVNTLSVIPIKIFFDSNEPAAIMSKGEAELPGWVLAGDVSKALADLNVDPFQNYVLCRSAFPGAITKLRNFRIPPYLPKALGGGGLTWKKAGVSVKKHCGNGYRKALATLLTDESKDRDPGVLSRIWLNAKKRYSSMASAEVERMMEDIEYRRGKDPPVENTRVWFDGGTDFRENALSRANRRDSLMFRNTEVSVQLSQVSKSLSKRLRVLTERWKSAHPVVMSTEKAMEKYKVLREEDRIWIPKTEDPTRPGTFGVPWYVRDSLISHEYRALVLEATNLMEPLGCFSNGLMNEELPFVGGN